MKIPVANLYYLLAYAWGQADSAREREADEAQIYVLPDLLAFILAQRISGLLKRGLDRSYVEESLVFAGVRGKIQFGETLKENLLQSARTRCLVEEFRYDVLQNQILRSTLRSLLALSRLDPKVRAEVGLVYRKMEGVSVISVRRSDFRRVRIHRNNRAYAFVIHLCRLIHESLMLDEDGTARFADVRQRRGVMARIFEQFVASFYAAEQTHYQVGIQPRLNWNAGAPLTSVDMNRLPQMSPDVTLDAPDRRIVLDTKFYRRALIPGRFGGEKVRSAHLYQIFTYLENRNAQLKAPPRNDGILLYPVVRDAFHFVFQLKGHRIEVRSIDLDQDWQEIHRALLKVIGLS